MKKLKLTPIAVALLLGAGLAHADVYIDGSIDGSVGITDRGDGNTGAVDIDGKLGFGGKEQFDNGGYGIWRYEAGFTDQSRSTEPNRSTSGLYTREAWAGVGGDFGTVRVGQMKSPLYDLLYSQYEDTGADTWIAEYGLGQATRPQGTLRYDSPNFNGLAFSGAYNFETESDNDHYGFDVGARYVQQGFFVDGAYQQRKNADGSDDISVGNANRFDSQTWMASAGYNFQNGFGLNGGYKALEYTPAGGSKVDQDLWFAQGSYKTGKHGVYLTYTQFGDLGDQAHTGAKAIAARYNYSLSKRSIGYVEGRYIDNDGNASYAASNDIYDYSGPAGESTSRLMAGLKTVF